MSLLSDSQAAAIAAQWADAELELARLFGVGGASWTRTRRTGATPAADGSEATATVAGYALRVKVNVPAAAVPGATVSASKWVFVAAATVDLTSDDTIVSDADGTIRFAAIGAASVDQGVLTIDLQPIPETE